MSAGLRVRRSQRIEQVRLIRSQIECFLKECPGLGEVADVQRIDAAIVKLVGAARQRWSMRHPLVADLNIDLRPGNDLNLRRKAVLKVFEHRFGFGKLFAVENSHGLLEGA